MNGGDKWCDVVFIIGGLELLERKMEGRSG